MSSWRLLVKTATQRGKCSAQALLVLPLRHILEAGSLLILVVVGGFVSFQNILYRLCGVWDDVTPKYIEI